MSTKGEIYLFGSNEYGQIGLELKSKKIEVPVKVTRFDKAVKVFTGPLHMFAITSYYNYY